MICGCVDLMHEYLEWWGGHHETEWFPPHPLVGAETVEKDKIKNVAYWEDTTTGAVSRTVIQSKRDAGG